MSEILFTEVVSSISLDYCSTCKKSNKEVSFYRRGGKARSDCIGCFNHKQRTKVANGRTQEEVDLANPCRVKNISRLELGVLVRDCKICKSTKSESEFMLSDRIYGTCKECILKTNSEKYKNSTEKKLKARERSRDWVDKNKVHVKEKKYYDRLFKTYGLTKTSYDDLLKVQNGGCYICKVTSENSLHGVLVVDHCHKSNKVRGLLCTNCNSALGLLKDSTEILSSAIRYLEKEKSNE